MITIYPQCLGLSLDESLMVKVLQASYGVPGKEQVNKMISSSYVLLLSFLHQWHFSKSISIFD